MEVFLYALSTCFHCRRTKQWLDNHNVKYKFVDVDLADEEEKKRLVKEVKELTGASQFPVIKVGDEHVTGFNEERLKKLLGVE
jgi:glutaredoxin-like protein NrdH